MDLVERIEEEMSQGFDQLKKLEVGSEEYNTVFKSIKELELLKSSHLDSELSRDLDERKMRIEENKATYVVVNSGIEDSDGKIERRTRIVEKVIGVVGSFVITLMVVRAEQTAIISSKAFDSLSKIKTIFR